VKQLGPLIASHFHYPPEAEENAIEGVVVLRLSITASGALVGVRVVGRCPHAVLCEAGARTVTAAGPFPPPPVELGGAAGGRIEIDFPVRYQLD
jgi:protein TonB